MTRAGKKIVSLGLAVLLGVGGLATGAPPLAMPAYAATAGSYGQPNDGIDFADLEDKDIYFGTYKHATALTYTSYGSDLGVTYDNGKKPILWRVMEEETTGTVTFLSEYALDGYYFYHDYSAGTANQWESSDIRNWLNTDSYEGKTEDGDEETYGFLHSNKSGFTSAELGAPVATANVNTTTYNVSNESKGSTQNTTDHFYIPWGIYSYGSGANIGKVSWSANDDLSAIDTYELDDKIAKLRRGISVHSWLRSPGSSDSGRALYVNSDGYVNNGYVINSLGIRPAFQFNPASVLFTSKITSGGVAADGETTEVANYYSSTGEAGRENFKLTIVSDQITAPAITDYTSGSSTVTVAPGGSIVLNSTDNTEKLVYKIVYNDNSTRKIVGYGIGAADSITVNGTANLQGGSPDLTVDGNYTLYVWAQKDYDHNSHEGSEPRYFELKVETPPSNNATLQFVAGKTITAGDETGTDSDPKTAAITVDNSTTSIALGDITVATGATAKLYSDNNFTSEETSINLTAGDDTDIYIKVTAQDGNNVLYYKVTVTREGSTEPPPDSTLEVARMDNETVQEEQSYSRTVPVNYTGTGTLQYSTDSALPTGVSLVTLGSSGVVQGTPETGTAGSYPIDIKVTDGVLEEIASYTLTVTTDVTPTQLTLATPTDLTVTEGEPFTKTMDVSYNGSDTLEYDITGLPQSVGFNSTTGEINGAADAGTAANSPYTVEVTVSDNNGLEDTKSFELRVLPGSTPSIPVTSITVTGENGRGSITDKGGSLQMLADVQPADATNRTVTWSVTGPATISSSGLLAATGNGTATVTAAANDGSNVSGQMAVSISGQDSYIPNPNPNPGGNDSGSDDSGSSYTPTAPLVTGRRTDFPYTASKALTGATDTTGHLTLTVTDAMAKELLEAAKGKDANGVTLSFTNGAAGAKSLSVVFEEAALGRINTAGAGVSVQTGLFRFSLDKPAVASLDSQTTGRVTVSAKPAANLSDAAKALIGSRPVLDITITDSAGKSVTSLGRGTMVRGIAYTPTASEQLGGLYAIRVNGADASLITRSSYVDGYVIWSGNTCSVYGVGYKAAPSFTDTTNSKARDDIAFSVSRELLSGTSATAFSPERAVTHNTLAAALNKLSQSGNAVKTLATDKALTREDMALLVMEYVRAEKISLPVMREAVIFTDYSSVSGLNRNTVRDLQQAGILNGRAATRFEPSAGASRADAAATLRRLAELQIDETTAHGFTRLDGGKSQYIGSTGRPVTGWRTVSGDKYYFGADGVMKTGMQTIDSKRYCFYSNGKMVAGDWVQVGGKWYYFKADGTMAVNTTVDGHEVGSDGVRKE